MNPIVVRDESWLIHNNFMNNVIITYRDPADDSRDSIYIDSYEDLASLRDLLTEFLDKVES